LKFLQYIITFFRQILHTQTKVHLLDEVVCVKASDYLMHMHTD